MYLLDFCIMIFVKINYKRHEAHNSVIICCLMLSYSVWQVSIFKISSSESSEQSIDNAFQAGRKSRYFPNTPDTLLWTFVITFIQIKLWVAWGRMVWDIMLIIIFWETYLLDNTCTMGRAKASVLPLPVMARPITSLQRKWRYMYCLSTTTVHTLH